MVITVDPVFRTELDNDVFSNVKDNVELFVSIENSGILFVIEGVVCCSTFEDDSFRGDVDW